MITHSTGHEKRLNRLTHAAFFGTEDYSKEELVAEIGAATLVNHCGIETSSSFRNNAAYIQNWLKVMKDDKRFIVSAAGKAGGALSSHTTMAPGASHPPSSAEAMAASPRALP